MEHRPAYKDSTPNKQNTNRKTNSAVQSSALLTVQSRNQNLSSSSSFSESTAEDSSRGVSRGLKLPEYGTHEERVQGFKVKAAVRLVWLFSSGPAHLRNT